MRIPRRNIVGKMNEGWQTAMATLSFERGTAFLAEQVKLTRLVDQLIDIARNTPLVDGRTALDDDGWPAARAAARRGRGAALDDLPQRQPHRPHRHAERRGVAHPPLLLRAAAARLRPGDGGARPGHPHVGRRGQSGAGHARQSSAPSWVSHYLVAFSSTIAAGSKDIQRNIIGERILGLPR